MTIADALQQSVSTFLSDMLGRMHASRVGYYRSEKDVDRLEVNIQEKKDNDSEALLLGINIDHEVQQVQLNNILIPYSEYKKGYGFGVIHEILKVATAYNYDFLIVEMVDSFYDRMREKGAKLIYCEGEIVDDAVLVDHETQLLSHRSLKN